MLEALTSKKSAVEFAAKYTRENPKVAISVIRKFNRNEWYATDNPKLQTGDKLIGEWCLGVKLKTK